MQFNCHRKACRMLSCVAILCTHLRHRSRQFPSNLPLPPAWSGNRSPLYRSSPNGHMKLRKLRREQQRAIEWALTTELDDSLPSTW